MHRSDEKFYHNILQATMDGFLLVNDEGKILDANKVYEQMSGYSKAELCTLHISDLEARETRSQTAHHIKKIIETGWHRFKTVHKKKNGTTIAVEISTIYSPDHSEFISFIKDITERLQTEKNLRTALEFNQQIVENSPFGILVFKESGPCVLANPAAEKIVGATAEQMLKLNYRTMDSYKSTGVLDDIIMALRTGRIVQKEVHTTNTYGREVWFEGVISSFQATDEKHVLFIFHDIFERKRTEKELLISKQELEEHYFKLERKNIALQEMIEQVRQERNRTEKIILANVEQLILPLINRIKTGNIPNQRLALETMEDNIQSITSDFGSKVSDKLRSLTNREIEICNLVKQGLSSKEIAGILGISPRGIETHRRNIRKKLRITRHKINLAAYLSNL